MDNGKTTLFWSDIWVGEGSTKDMFDRLFLLWIQKETKVLDIKSCVN